MAMKKAVFPGSFDPLTNGHLDLIERSLTIFDKVIVGVLNNTSKNGLFTIEERVGIISELLKPYKERVSVDAFSGLLVDFVRKVNCRVVLRGLRAISDFDYEAQMALINRRLSGDIETFFLMTTEENSYVSSTLVKQVSQYGGSVDGMVPKLVAKKLKEKFKNQN